MKKLTLFAMTEKGHSVASSLLSACPDIIDTVVSSRDPGLANDYFDEIANTCRKNSIRFYRKSDSFSIRTEYVLAVSWRWLIDAGSARLIVFHDSLLPRYRGFNPLVTALINGDTEIGVTALYGGAEYDRGAIIARSASAISYPLTIQEAIKIILTNYTALALRLAEFLLRDEEPSAIPQREEDASYSLWRDEDDYFIDWTAPAARIRRMVDALGYPYKGAATTIDNKVVRILSAEAFDDVNIVNRVPGKVIFIRGSKPFVVCGDGLLRINEVVEDQTGTSVLPLSRFRTRLGAAARPVARWDAGDRRRGKKRKG